jgi:hypothetical protein
VPKGDPAVERVVLPHPWLDVLAREVDHAHAGLILGSAFLGAEKGVVGIRAPLPVVALIELKASALGLRSGLPARRLVAQIIRFRRRIRVSAVPEGGETLMYQIQGRLWASTYWHQCMKRVFMKLNSVSGLVLAICSAVLHNKQWLASMN